MQHKSRQQSNNIQEHSKTPPKKDYVLSASQGEIEVIVDESLQQVCTTILIRSASKFSN